jgi:hypothetical protein
MLDIENDITTRKGRLAELDELCNGLMQAMKERGVAYGDDERGATGLFNRRFKIQGTREYPVIVEEYSMDHGLLRQWNKLLKAAAVERRWLEKAGQGAANGSRRTRTTETY